jgi:arylsulfatase B
MQGADAYMERFAHIEDVHRRIFAATLAHLDDSVGRILDKLRECELVENTVVVFLSDNGGPTRELTSSNRPLRGEKGQFYEGGIRVPFLIRWPGRMSSGQVDDRPMLSLDLPAVFLSAAGSDNQGRYGDGLDFFGRGSEHIEHDSLYWRVGPNSALRQGDWKIVRHARRGGPPGEWELYNLRDDVGESRDLAGVQPERVAALAELWKRWDREMVEARWR